MADTPVTQSDELELRAIAAYRAKYPNGIPWQDLHADTRLMWTLHVQQGAGK